MGMFYEDEGIIGSREPQWIQGAINALIGLFIRVGLLVNVSKYKTMNSQPGEIHTGVSEEDFSWRGKG